MPPIEERKNILNEVTWYSKTLAVFLFVILVCGAFFMGIWYQKQIQSLNANQVSDQVIHLNAGSESIIQDESKIMQSDNLTIIYGTDGHKTEFAKDSSHIYLLTETGYTPLTKASINLVELDTTSFEALGSRNLYFKDKNHIYFNSPQDFTTLTKADTNTFALIYDTAGYETDYARDKNLVFYGDKLVDNADSSSFTKIASSTFAKDKTRVFSEDIYYSTDVVIGANPDDFTPLNTPEEKGSKYGKDTQYIYCGAGKIENADLASFVVETPWSAKDKNQQYDSCTVYDPKHP